MGYSTATGCAREPAREQENRQAAEKSLFCVSQTGSEKMKQRLVARRLRVPVGLVLMALAIGCGPKVGSIVGTVTYQGKPVRWGAVKVVWTSSDSESLNAGSSVLNKTGAYEVGRVPAGSSAKLFLAIPLIPMGGMLGGNRPNPRVVNEVKERIGYVDVPEKYTNPETSGFSLEVKPG